MLYTAAIMLTGTVLLEAFANLLCVPFGLSDETQTVFISATRIISAGFLFAGISLSLQGVFQALNKGLSSLIISLLRQLILILPVAWGLSLLIASNLSNAWIIWITFPFAEIITAAVAAMMMTRIIKKNMKN